MNKKLLALPLLAALALPGCAGMSETGRTTATGAGVGAATGAIIGSFSGNAGWGALAGGAIGGAGGYMVGRSREAQRDAYWRGVQSGRAGR